MEQNTVQSTQDISQKPVDFSYPEGYQQMLDEVFDYLPAEERAAAYNNFIRGLLLY